MHRITQTQKGYDIVLTRGDSLYLIVGISKNGEPYTPQEGDTVRFAMCKEAGTAVLTKVIPTDTLQLTIKPEDTKNLPMYSRYDYDIELTTADGDVDTFIEGHITLDKEVS